MHDALFCEPDHVKFDYSAKTFWKGIARSDCEFLRYQAIAQDLGGCNIKFGAQTLQDALACYR